MNKIVVYGVNCLQAKRTAEWLKSIGKTIVAFCDGNSDLWGKSVFDVPITSPNELPIADTVVVIAAYGQRTTEIIHLLNERNIDWLSIGHLVLNHEVDNFRNVFELFSDDTSKQTFFSLIMSRGNLNFKNFSSIVQPIREQYFGYWNQEHQNMTAIDCGAYCGENLEDYLFYFKNVKKYYAFEPNPAAFRALSNRSERLKCEWMLQDDAIICINAGLGECDSEIGFTASHKPATSYTTTLEASEADKAAIKSIDGFLSGAQLDFLKSDIEGMEMSMLRGARETIRKWKPKIAISIYHTIWDMYEIPLYLKSLVPDYKFAARHYTAIDAETVLYAYVR
ncbi:MAG: FkbM family methyltransferase [Prevotellaceae bacterium]|jgi:FkbM family methyltransferase|nr:FkbM family methyltransferase [Prevotellaceae bacterium]